MITDKIGFVRVSGGLVFFARHFRFIGFISKLFKCSNLFVDNPKIAST
jgi:hypothetical protein